jgi:alanine dehydrogenase
MPGCANARHRRYVVSCYSWPGIHPEKCMLVYGRQLQPLLRTLAERGGVGQINPQGKFFERAIARAQLSRWLPEFQG